MLILCDSERLFGGLLSIYVYLMVDCHEFITTRGERLGLEAIFNFQIERIISTIEEILFVHMNHAYEFPPVMEMRLR